MSYSINNAVPKQSTFNGLVKLPSGLTPNSFTGTISPTGGTPIASQQLKAQNVAAGKPANTPFSPAKPQSPQPSLVSSIQTQIAAKQAEIDAANKAGYGQGGQFAGQQIPGTINQSTGQVVPPQPTAQANVPPPVQTNPQNSPADPNQQNTQQNQNQNNQGQQNQGNQQQNQQNSGTQTNYQQQDPNGLYAQLIRDAATRSQQQGADYTARQNEAEQYNKALQESRVNEAQGLAANASNPIPLEFQQGRAQILQNQYSQEQAALGAGFQGASSLVGAANTQQGLGNTLLGNAITGAAPQLGGYNQQPFNPLNPSGFGGGTSGSNLNDAVSGVVQKLQNGQMSYNDALNALSGYGQGGVNALQKALPPGFNVSQSNALAGQQGTIGPALTFANTAMDSLDKATQALGLIQNTNIPAVNAAANWASQLTGIGSEKTRAYHQAVAEARNAYQQVLAATRGGTPTDYGDQAKAAIPDNPTPNDIAAAKQTLASLGQAKKDIYGNPGQSNGGGSQNDPLGIR